MKLNAKICVQEQVQHILWNTFFWKSAQISYDKVNPVDKEKIHLSLDFPSFLKGGIARAYDEERAITCLKGRNTLLKPKPDFPKLLEPLNLSGKERKISNLIDGLRSVQDILEASIEPTDETAQFLFVLFCLEFCEIAE